MSTIADQQGVLAGIPKALRVPLLEEFGKLVRNYREQRWEPAELNGGKFSEIVYTILRGFVDNSFPPRPSKPKNMVDACRALEQATGYPRSVRIQIPRMLLALYEIRNNRNVGHVGADVDPSHMDATVVLSTAKWIMAELVRIFHATTPEEASAVVEGLTDRTVPLLWSVGDKMRVLSTKLNSRDKALAILYGVNEAMDARRLAESVEYGNLSRFRSTVLKAAHKEGLIDFDKASDRVTISPLGIRYVEEAIQLEV